MKAAAAEILVGDCRAVLAQMADCSVNCCVTSPPYWGLRDYGVDGQIGLEGSVEAWVAELVAVFREVRRVLRDDGTLWLNLGDAFAGSGRGGNIGKNSSTLQGTTTTQEVCKRGSQKHADLHENARQGGAVGRAWVPPPSGLKQKDLIGMPWIVAFALRADGWYLRRDIIWHKPNPMPESVSDRPTTSHEYIFLMSKSPRYHFDSDAIAEATTCPHDTRPPTGSLAEGQRPAAVKRECPNSRMNVARNPGADNSKPNVSSGSRRMPPIGGKKAVGEHGNGNATYSGNTPEWRTTRNARSVWTIATQGYKGSHFATFPRELAARCIKAGCPAGGLVLDPFAGTGTTVAEAVMLSRRGVGIELNPDYALQARKRIHETCGLLAHGGAA